MVNIDSNKIVNSSSNDFRVLYVCSAARSGSTLTDMFIGGHSQAASLGELNFLSNGISLNHKCSCGMDLRICNQWREVFDAIKHSTNIDFLINPYTYNLWDAISSDTIDYKWQTRSKVLAVNFRKAWLSGRNLLPNLLCDFMPIPPSLSKALDNKMNLYREIARCWEKSIIVDSSKNDREAIELFKKWPDSIKIVLLTRDGRGVYFSRRSSGYTQSESIKGWLNYYQRALPALDKFIPSESLLKIRYEDLATKPEEVGRILCNFAHIPFEPEMLDFTRFTRHLVGGNNMRFSSNKRIELDTRWQTELCGDELDFFTRTGGDMNLQLGYQ